MLLYIFIANTVFDLIDTSSTASTVSDDIRLGQLNNYLIRPFSYFFYQFAQECGTKVTKLPITISVYGVLGALLFTLLNVTDISFTISITSLLFFFAFILLSFFWNFMLDYLLGTLGFWIENPWVVFFIKGEIIMFLCGLAIPIDLFPPFLRSFLEYLPFKYYVFFPYKILNGTVAFNECMWNLLLLIAWVGGISLFTYIVWKRSVKNYTATGG
jgi:ABC-2 type transport system permease protein